jgi:hypothetical protein
MPEGPALLAAVPHLRRAQATLHRRDSFVLTEPARPTEGAKP